MKGIKHAALAMVAMAALAGGCVAFNVGEPEHYRLDCGKDGSILITRQKKMSVGLCPAALEGRSRPPESVAPIIGWNYFREKDDGGQFMRDNREPLFRYMFFGLFTTPWALLVTPWYGDYSCDSHYWTAGNVELLSKFPKDVQDKVHVKTVKDKGRDWGAIRMWGHSALLGCHRYATVVIEELDEGEERSTYEN